MAERGQSDTRPCGFKHGDPLLDEDDRMRDLADLLELVAGMIRQGSEFQGVRPQGSNDEYSYKALLFRTPLSKGDS